MPAHAQAKTIKGQTAPAPFVFKNTLAIISQPLSDHRLNVLKQWQADDIHEGEQLQDKQGVVVLPGGLRLDIVPGVPAMGKAQPRKLDSQVQQRSGAVLRVQRDVRGYR